MRMFVLAVLAVVMTASSASASVLGTILRHGAIGSPILNSIEDRNAEVIRKAAGNVAAAFEVGDMVDLYLQFETITSSDGFFVNTGLNDATAGGIGYKLFAMGTLTVSSLTPIAGPGSKADIEFTGSLDLKERIDNVGFVFTAGIAAANGVFAGASYIATIGTAGGGFVSLRNAQTLFASIPTTGTGVNADFGLSLLAGGGDLGLVLNGLEGNINGTDTGTFHTFVGSTQTKSLFNATNVLGDDKFDLGTNTNIQLLSQVPDLVQAIAL